MRIFNNDNWRVYNRDTEFAIMMLVMKVVIEGFKIENYSRTVRDGVERPQLHEEAIPAELENTHHVEVLQCFTHPSLQNRSLRV